MQSNTDPFSQETNIKKSLTVNFPETQFTKDNEQSCIRLALVLVSNNSEHYEGS